MTTALEEAIEDGLLSPGTPGFRRRQAQVANRALREPSSRQGGHSRLEAIHAERLGQWLERGQTRGGAERRAIIEPVAGMVAADPPAIDRDDAGCAVAPALRLLGCGQDGIALTQTGALNRALVREVAERWPAWWNAELFGAPNRETDLVQLCELHELLRGLRLLRRTGRQLKTTARGRKLMADPAALVVTLATELLTGDSFRAACTELAIALLLTGFAADFSERFAERIQPAIVAEGWQDQGEPPDVRDVSWAVANFLRPALAVGLLERTDDALFSREPLRVTAAGRAALIAALRARALAPRQRP